MTEKEKKPQLDLVAENAIICETIKKELRHHKLYTSYNINPISKKSTLTEKPNTLPDASYNDEDDHFLKIIDRAQLEPVKKYLRPQTESQEIGWIHQSLIDSSIHKGDVRITKVKTKTEITKYMEEYWKMREQRINLN